MLCFYNFYSYFIRHNRHCSIQKQFIVFAVIEAHPEFLFHPERVIKDIRSNVSFTSLRWLLKEILLIGRQGFSLKNSWFKCLIRLKKKRAWRWFRYRKYISSPWISSSLGIRVPPLRSHRNSRGTEAVVQQIRYQWLPNSKVNSSWPSRPTHSQWYHSGHRSHWIHSHSSPPVGASFFQHLQQYYDWSISTSIDRTCTCCCCDAARRLRAFLFCSFLWKNRRLLRKTMMTITVSNRCACSGGVRPIITSRKSIAIGAVPTLMPNVLPIVSRQHRCENEQCSDPHEFDWCIAIIKQ